MKIKVMDTILANKIAAGEVVERISSVVKELVENSIDAKSTVIVVDLIDSGTKSIKVIDNGIGMDRDDSLLCFERHATSKLLKEDDLFFINTLGFRGEALPSIASVSKVDMNTYNGNVGTHIVIHGGKLITQEEGVKRSGTTMEIADLFYNTPARLKYLKSDTTELSNVTTYLEKLALSYPKISFTLTNNGKKIVYTSGSGDILKTIHEIYGFTVSSNMIEINASNDDYDIHGFVCKPQVQKSNRNHMSTIVNGRIVKNSDVNHAICEGYHTFIPDIKFPVVVLYIDTDPTLIDVNIHPTKQDIKFSKLSELTSLIKDSINEALRKAILIPKIEVTTIDTKYYEPDIVINTVENEVVSNELEQVTLDFRENISFEKANEIVHEHDEENLKVNELIKKIDLYAVGIALGTYIIAQNENGMYLIDQHAAQERINYEKVLNAFKSDKVITNQLLIPISIELSASEALKIKENKNILDELGIIIDEFGINTFLVKEHPTWIREGVETESIKRIFDIIIEGKYNFDKIRFQDHVAATMACKMSVKGNEAITLEQAQQLLDDLVLCENPYNCPHGRPTIITFTKYELERMFKRVMN